MASFGWPEHATPGYIRVARRPHATIDLDAGEMVLVPTFRLPTLIHTRSGNAKYLNEISNTHPFWVQRRRRRAARAVATGDLVRVTTRIGYFVARVWATPGHPAGRRRAQPPHGPLAAARQRRQPLGERQGRPRAQPTTASGGCATPSGVGTVRERRPGQLADLLGGPGRAPEPHVPGAARPVVGHALLAAAGDVRAKAEPGDRYGDIEVDTAQVARGVPGVAGA